MRNFRIILKTLTKGTLNSEIMTYIYTIIVIVMVVVVEDTGKHYILLVTTFTRF